MQDYDGLTSDLITREFGIDFIKHDEKPKNLCFALETQDGQFYRELETALQNADVSKNKFPEEIDGKFSHMGVSIYPAKKLGLDLIQKHDFEHSKESFAHNIQNLDDDHHAFKCNFEYDEEHYQMQLYFSSTYPRYDNFTFVNFTRVDGKPLVQNQEISIFHEGFNSTVIFYNQLEKIVTLSFDQKERDGKNEIFDGNDAIPPNKKWSHSFSYFNHEPMKLQYKIEPYNLSGTITLKSHPKCMDVDYTLSLFSQVNLEIKLPTYVPEGYVNRCNVETGFVGLISLYSKNNLDSYKTG